MEAKKQKFKTTFGTLENLHNHLQPLFKFISFVFLVISVFLLICLNVYSIHSPVSYIRIVPSPYCSHQPILNHPLQQDARK